MSEQVQEDAVRFNWYLLILNWLSDEMDKFINHSCVGISLNVHHINLYDFGTFGCEDIKLRTNFKQCFSFSHNTYTIVKRKYIHRTKHDFEFLAKISEFGVL